MKTHTLFLSLFLFLFFCLIFTGTVSAADSPNANFTSNVTNGTSALDIQFYDTSTGNVSSWDWDFGDNSTSTEKNPQHNYTKVGTYNVKLSVNGSEGNSTMIRSDYITVYSETGTNQFNNPGFETADFSNWTVGTGTSIKTTAHTGSYSAYLSSSVNYLQQTIDLTCVDNFSFWAYGASSSLKYYDLEIYIDGVKVKTINPTSGTWTQYTYNNTNYTGWHDITIKWVSNLGLYIDDFATTITTNRANFTSNATEGFSPMTVQFNDTSIGLIYGWQWDFDGDGVIDSTDENPSYSYTKPGLYTVKLTLLGANNSSITKTNHVMVYTKANANRFNNSGFETGDLSGWIAGPDVNISSYYPFSGDYSLRYSKENTTYLKQNIDLTLVDNFSFYVKTTYNSYSGVDYNTTIRIYVDGALVKSITPEVDTWTKCTINTNYVGKHNITIVLINIASGEIFLDNFLMNMTKNSANFTATTPTNGKLPLTVQFNDTSIGLVGGLQWDFDGDGVIDSTDENPSYTYTKPGNYTVTLTVTNIYTNSTKTISKLITILPPTNTRTGNYYSTIQEAIDDNETVDGDTIIVGSGSFLETYTENIVINKRLNIICQGNVQIVAVDSNIPVINITYNGNNSLIKNFIITGAFDSCGVYISPSTKANLIQNIITGNKIGVIVDGAADMHFNSIYDNILYGLQSNGRGVNATNNWWGTNNPSYLNNITPPTVKTDIYNANMTSSVDYNPWIILKGTSSVDLLKNGSNSTITVDMTYNSNGDDTSSEGTLPDMPASFSFLMGTLNFTSTNITKGKGTLIVTAGDYSGLYDVVVTVNGYNISVFLTLDNMAPVLNKNIIGGTYNTTIEVSLVSDDVTATIYYTTDSTDPSTSSTRKKYTGPITISNTTTLRFVGVDLAGNWSPIYITSYVIGNMGIANSSWSTYQENNNHTGQSNYNGSISNNIFWTYNINVKGSPVVSSDGTVYVCSYEGKLYAFTSSGTLKWTYTTSSYLLASPSIGSDGTIYICSWMNSTLYAINPDGTLKWKYRLNNYNFGSTPTIAADGTIYVCTNNGTLYAINKNGTLKWTYVCYGVSTTLDSINYNTPVMNIYGTSPAIAADGTIYMATYDGILFAINPDGTPLWNYTTGKAYYDSPSIGSDGTIYIGTNDGILYALNSNGSLKWSKIINASTALYGSPAIGFDGTIYVAGKTALYAVSSNGTILWTFETGNSNTGSLSPTISSDGTIYLGSNSTLYAISSSGTELWNYSTGNIVSPVAIGYNGAIYIGTNAGTNSLFYAFKDVSASFINSNNKFTVKFTDKSSGTPSSWYWDFGDGYTSTQQNPTHTYLKMGTYTVKLTVTNAYGNDTYTQKVTIDITSPTASATVKSGVYNRNKVVWLRMSEAGTIYYTTDGSTPTSSSKRFTGGITIFKSTKLRFIAIDKAGNKSPVYTYRYTIDKTRPFIRSTTPKNKAGKVSRTGTIIIRFSEKIKASSYWSKIYVKNLKTGKKIRIKKWIKNNVLYIKTSKRTSKTRYRIYIPTKSIRDLAGNKLGKSKTITFKTK